MEEVAVVATQKQTHIPKHHTRMDYLHLKKICINGGDLLGNKNIYLYRWSTSHRSLVKDGDGVTTLTQTIAYDGDGNVSSITKDYA